MTLVIWQQHELIKIICILKSLLVVTVMLTTLLELFVIEDTKVLTEELNQRSLPSSSSYSLDLKARGTGSENLQVILKEEKSVSKFYGSKENATTKNFTNNFDILNLDLIFNLQ